MYGQLTSKRSQNWRHKALNTDAATYTPKVKPGWVGGLRKLFGIWRAFCSTYTTNGVQVHTCCPQLCCCSAPEVDSWDRRSSGKSGTPTHTPYDCTPLSGRSAAMLQICLPVLCTTNVQYIYCVCMAILYICLNLNEFS